MKSAIAVPAVAPVVGRRVVRSVRSARPIGGGGARRKPAAAPAALPPCDSPADIPNLLRAMGRLGFMRRGRPEDYNELPA